MHRHLASPRLSASSTKARDLFSSSEAFTQNEYPTSASKHVGTYLTYSELRSGPPRSERGVIERLAKLSAADCMFVLALLWETGASALAQKNASCREF
jgi:hypothetical protein